MVEKIKNSLEKLRERTSETFVFLGGWSNFFEGAVFIILLMLFVSLIGIY